MPTDGGPTCVLADLLRQALTFYVQSPENCQHTIHKVHGMLYGYRDDGKRVVFHLPEASTPGNGYMNLPLPDNLGSGVYYAAAYAWVDDNPKVVVAGTSVSLRVTAATSPCQDASLMGKVRSH